MGWSGGIHTLSGTVLLFFPGGAVGAMLEDQAAQDAVVEDKSAQPGTC